MHLIFERSNGRFKSNCNILALAWMPYYNEPTFRRAHLEYHHRLLSHLAGPTGANRPAEPPLLTSDNRDGIQELWRQHNDREPSRPSREADVGRGLHESSVLTNQRRTTELEQNHSQASRRLELALRGRHPSNSRLCEQYQRYVYMKYGQSRSISPNCDRTTKADPASDLAEFSDAAVNDFIDEQYGRMPSFGWLAIGNIGRIVGVTLTSTVQAPTEIDGRKPPAPDGEPPNQDCNEQDSSDLIVLCDNNHGSSHDEKVEKVGLSSAPMGAATNADLPRPDRKCARDNHNLRGHLDEIILVKWNELYQKLASVDSKGNVLIWSKVNDKFTIQTPFYNKSKSVADFKWSNDGKTALICYTDSFILVGGSSGQRHWHSMLNLDDYHITCATWAPNDEQLLLGVSNGNVVIIDLPTSELTELVVGQANIRAMCWSSSEINLRHLSGGSSAPFEQSAAPKNQQDCDLVRSETCSQPNQQGSSDFQVSAFDLEGEEGEQPIPRQLGSAVVNRRRLSRNCALFCRYRPPSLQDQSSPRRNPNNHSARQRQPQMEVQQKGASKTSSHKDILSIDYADNTIKLFNGGLSDSKPREIQVNLESYLMAWSSDGKVLAVAGFNIYTSAPSVGYLRCKYLNAIKFYNQRGDLIHERKINFTRYPITALTWAHEDKRLFVATGPRLHCAKVYMGIPKLSLLSLSCLQRHTKLMDKSDVLKNLIKGQLVASVLNWQSFNCPLDISCNLLPASSERAEPSMDCTQRDGSSGSYSDKSIMMRPATASMSASSSGSDNNESNGEQTSLANNINIANYQLPAKLKSKIDQLFLQTVRQPYDEQFTLNDVAWHVPKNRKRHYCTLICYTHELADIGCVGHQYKAHELLANQHIGLTGSESRDSDQFKIFILYVEFQGSLIPILKARRIGFLKPEFVLFDPEDNSSGYYHRNHKVSDVSNQLGRLASNQSNDGQRQRKLMSDNILDSNCAMLHGTPFGRFNNCDPANERRLAPNEASSCRPAFMNNPLLSVQSRSAIGSPSTSFGSRRAMINQDQQLFYLLKISLQQSSREKYPSGSISTLQHEVLRAIERQRSRGAQANTSTASNQLATLAASGGAQVGMRCLPENKELVRIKSNIWGTKFKMIYMGHRRIGAKVVLGSMKYKASLLHLQPRQIFLSLKDLSNYCTLCSMHHHTRLPPKRYQSKRAPVGAAKSVDLLDLPIGLAPSSFATPVRSSPRRLSRNRQRSGQQDRPANLRDSGEKVILPVGDNIRIAPKLEPNQKYKFANSLDSAPSRAPNSATSRLHPSTSLSQPSAPGAHSRLSRLDWGLRNVDRRLNSSLPVQNSSSQSVDMIPCDQDNDILILSLDQRDRVQVEMSSSTPARRGSSLGPSHGESGDQIGEAEKMSEFLQANRTLKSIQTITKMIVDLSSRAKEDNESRHNGRLVADEPSPVKMLKTEDGGVLRSPAREYIPPETPVHRPRGLASNKRADLLLKAQSATNSPFGTPLSAHRHFKGDQAGGTNEHKSLGLHPDDPLPPPPPSVPFRRKLSTSAKRFFDGSLRSLAGISGAGSTSLTGYLTGSDDPDSEEYESLVQHRHRSDRRSRPKTRAHHHQSQPCTPLRERGEGSLLMSGEPDKKQSILDLASLRSQVVRKLRQSTNWMSSARHLDEITGSSPLGQRNAAHQHGRSSRRQPGRSASCTKRSNWVHKSANKDHLEQPPALQGSLRRSSSASSSSSSSDLISLISSAGSSSSLSSSDNDMAPADREFGFLDKTIRSKLFRSSSKLSKSVREFGELNRKRSSSSRREKRHGPMDALGRKLDVGSGERQKPAARRRRAKRSLCQNSDCCCAREFKLSNRPPVWNEYSQVYQLDFGGRVTQESAKNLQIDFNGNLALQFGRIDKCTYTLDYQFPFNAVQAMSIALASLTQRLK